MLPRFLILLLAILGVVAALFSSQASAKGKALIIGINDYVGTDFDLNAAVPDAHLVRRFLLETSRFKADEIRMLLDEDATQRNILETMLNWLVSGTQSGDDVFMYYSGHGYFIPDKDGDEEDGRDEVLVSHENAAISDDVLGEMLKLLADRNVTMIIDSCHSGTISRSANLGVITDGGDKVRVGKQVHASGASGSGTISLPDIRRAQERSLEISTVQNSPATEHQIWTAVGPSQVAFEDLGLGHGVFTHFLITGILGAADRNRNGQVTTAELLDYTRDRSSSWCRDSQECQRRGLGLTPDVTGEKSLVIADNVTDSGSSQQNVTHDNSGLQNYSPPLNDLASDVLGSRNDAGLRVEILPGANLRADEQLKFRITSRRPGWLLFLDLDARGRLVQIYPNRLVSREKSRANWIRANAPLTIPDPYYGIQFTADGSARGDGQIIALLVEDGVGLEELFRRHGSFEPVPDPKAYFEAVASTLREIAVSEGRFNRAIRWSVAYKGYQIR